MTMTDTRRAPLWHYTNRVLALRPGEAISLLLKAPDDVEVPSLWWLTLSARPSTVSGLSGHKMTYRFGGGVITHAAADALLRAYDIVRER